MLCFQFFWTCCLASNTPLNWTFKRVTDVVSPSANFDQVTKQWLASLSSSRFSIQIGLYIARIMAIVSSASNLLAQLDEDDEALRLNALQSLNNVVHDFWFQIASSIASVEAFYEDETFTHRELAALVASKVQE